MKATACRSRGGGHVSLNMPEGGAMIKRIVLGLLLWIEDVISRWAERRELEATREKQEANDARDRGDAGDVRDRMRQRAGAQRERDAGGGMPPSDDRGGTDKGG